MAGKRSRETQSEDAAPQSTPKKLRFGPPSQTPAKGTPTKSVLKNATASTSRALDSPEATTPSNRPSKKAGATFVTPTRRGSKEKKTLNPTTRVVDRSARKKATRNIIERAAAGDLSDDEATDRLAAQIYDTDEGANTEDSELEDGNETAAHDNDALPSTEGHTGTDDASAATTPSKRGRGRPKGSKNKRTPTPPPNLPPHEHFFFQNRPSAWKHTSNTPNNLKLMTHGEYYAAMEKYVDPHASSIAALHKHHATSFPKWDFELREGFTVVLHGYGSKRRILTEFCDYLYEQRPDETPPVTLLIQAHHPAFTLRALVHAIAKAVGLELTSLPATIPAIWQRIEDQLTTSPPPISQPVYVFISTLTARPLTTTAALNLLQNLARNPHIALLMTASNPSFPLLWPSNIRDALNPILHDATTFLPYDTGTGPPRGEMERVSQDADSGVADGSTPASASATAAQALALAALAAAERAREAARAAPLIPAPPPGLSALGPSAPDAVAELLGRKSSAVATRERVRWVLRSLPANARGLYQQLLEASLAAADAESRTHERGFGALHDEDAAGINGFNPFDVDPELNLDWDAPITGGAARPEPAPGLKTPKKRGRPRKNAGIGGGTLGRAAPGATSSAPLPAVSSKTLYNAASAAFLCSSEMAFRGLLREFVDHAMVEMHRGEIGAEGGEMLAVPMGRTEVEGVLEDLKEEE